MFQGGAALSVNLGDLVACKVVPVAPEILKLSHAANVNSAHNAVIVDVKIL